MAIEGKAIISMGTGDVISIVYPEEGLERAALFMKTAKVKREPGLFHGDAGFDPEEADVVMLFPNCEYALKTIDMWKAQIERLQQYYDEEKKKEKENEH